MEPEFKTSFIPKKTLTTTRRARGAVVGLFFVLSLILLLGAVLLSIGVFVYRTYLERSNEAKLGELEAAREAVDPDLIRELERLDIRLKTSQNLLSEHRALSSFFDFLEKTTLQTVQFESFTYAELSASEIAVTMDGKAKSFTSLALQSDAFAQSGVVHSPLFSNLDLDDTGNVTFEFTGVVDSSAVRYAKPLGASTSADIQASTTPADSSVEEDLDQIEEDLDALDTP